MNIFTLCVLILGTVSCEGEVEFVRVVGERAYLGYVDVYHGTSWYNLCNDGWDDKDASVVCRMLGYTGDDAQALNDSSNVQRYTFWNKKLDCTGNETSLRQCGTSTMSSACISNKSARIICSTVKGPDDFFLADFNLGIGRLDRYLKSITVITANVSGVADIVYDEVDQMVIWSDYLAGNIARCDINGGDKFIMYQSESTHNLIGLAIDAVSRLVFYTGGRDMKIGSIHIDTLKRNIIIETNLVWPYRIVLDSNTREIFWTDTQSHKIEKASYNGSSREVLLGNGSNSLSGIDLNGIYLYWCQYDNSAIGNMIKNGSAISLYHTDGWTECYDLTIYQEYIYCRDVRNPPITVLKKGEPSYSIAGLPVLEGEGTTIYYYKKGIKLIYLGIKM